MSYRFRFSLVLASLLVALVMVSALPAAAQDDPEDVIDSFYGWYLDYAGYDEASETFRNPLADGSYSERAELSTGLIERVAAMKAEFGGFGHDPFLCAQDIPASYTFEMLSGQMALVREHFGFNPYPLTLVVELAQQDGVWVIDDVVCQETVTPRGLTDTFYRWYLSQLPGSDAPAPQAEGVGYELLTASLRERIDAARSADTPGGGDPILCAQDFPQAVGVTPVMVGQNTATMLVREFFAGNPQPSNLTVRLTNADGWKIDDITCEVAPETVVELLYNDFSTFMRYDLDHNIERTPIADWNPYPWAQYMSQDLLDNLLAVYNSDEMRPADPFLCAQDIPVWVEGELRLSPASDHVEVKVQGAFPSGPDSYSFAELAQVELIAGEDGGWQLSAITCAK